MKPTMDEVVRIVLPLAANEVDDVTEKTRIVDDLDVSSADLVDIVLELEDRFEIEIRDEESRDLETLGDICGLIERKISEAKPA